MTWLRVTSLSFTSCALVFGCSLTTSFDALAGGSPLNSDAGPSGLKDAASTSDAHAADDATAPSDANASAPVNSSKGDTQTIDANPACSSSAAIIAGTSSTAYVATSIANGDWSSNAAAVIAYTDSRNKAQTVTAVAIATKP